MNLGEICGLIQDEEIVPLFVVAQVEQTVIGQDLLMLECSGKQELLEFEHIVLDFPEVGFDALHFFSFEIFKTHPVMEKPIPIAAVMGSNCLCWPWSSTKL